MEKSKLPCQVPIFILVTLNWLLHTLLLKDGPCGAWAALPLPCFTIYSHL